MSFARRTDSNHAFLRDEVFRKLCPVVKDTSKFGDGFPDLMIRTRSGKTLGIEIKTENGPLKKSQEDFGTIFPDFWRLVRNADDAMKVCNE